MKLSFDQIKSITAGAVRIWEENGNIRFSKCTQKQVDAWHKIDPVLGERAEGTTGVRLDFHTNSSRFGFTAANGTIFEIYINDVLLYSIGANDLTDGSFRIDIDNSSQEENRITLLLPSHQTGILSSVELDDGASVVPHVFDRKLLFIGDSITQGWDSGYDSLSYAYRVSRYLNAYSVIHGVGGGIFDQSVLDDELDYDPEIVIVAFGTNDWGRDTLEAIEKKCSDFFDKLLKKFGDKKIIAISPIWRANTELRNGYSFYDTCDMIKKQILDHGIFLVDGDKMVPHLTQFFADQYLHPNALGFGIYAENLLKAIKDYI